MTAEDIVTADAAPADGDAPGGAMLDPEEARFTVPTKYWSLQEDGRVQCDVCPRHCRLKEGQRGMCFVRARHGDQIVLTTHGRSSGFCIDPIEKKPLNHFLPGTPILSFGTAGCNLQCKFCQNWSISKSREFDTLADQADPETIARAAQQLGCRSVAFTYNDPVIFMEYAIDIAQACRERGVATVAVTAGYICPEPRVEFYNHIDAANIDLKAFTEEFYWKLTKSHLEDIKETLVYLKHETDVWFEITNLMIPGENDSQGEIEEMTGWVVEALGPDVPMHFTAFHPDYKMMEHPRTPPPTLAMARRVALKNGVKHAYVGNVYDPPRNATYCGGCGHKMIGRDRYNLLDWGVTIPDDGRNTPAHGACPQCGETLPGVFEAEPGTWGMKRQGVRLKDFALA